MLKDLQENLRARGIGLTLAGVPGRVHDLLQAEGLDAGMLGIVRGTTIEDELRAFAARPSGIAT